MPIYPSPSTIAALAASTINERRRAQYWRYVDSCMRGKRHPSTLVLAAPKFPVLPGMALEATDRRYIVGANGAWRRDKRENRLPANKSQIRLLPEPPKKPAEALKA